MRPRVGARGAESRLQSYDVRPDPPPVPNQGAPPSALWKPVVFLQAQLQVQVCLAGFFPVIIQFTSPSTEDQEGKDATSFIPAHPRVY